jgi:hypothetical protein
VGWAQWGGSSAGLPPGFTSGIGAARSRIATFTWLAIGSCQMA